MKRGFRELGAVVSLLFFSLVIFSGPVFCQERQARLAQEIAIWQQRVDGLTEGVVKDSGDVGESEEFLYLALLAKIWWKADPIKARKFLEEAASKVLSVWNNGVEENGDLTKNITNSQKTIQIIIEIDEKIGRSLAEKIATLIEAKGKKDGANSDLFAMIALQVVDKNPRLAYSIGVKALSLGRSPDIIRLIARLKTRDAKLADDLFGLALAAETRNYDYQFFTGLGHLAFDVRAGNRFSDPNARKYLSLLADRLALSALDEQNRTFCNLVSIAAPLIPEFTEYLPERFLAVKQHIDLCIPYSPSFTAEKAQARTKENAPRTPDEFIHAARDTSDPGLKAHYFSSAISILAGTRNFDEIISLLDDLSNDEKKAIGAVAWDSWRIEYASAAAFFYFENNDLASVFRVIDKTPKVIRPFVRFRLIARVSLDENREFVLENLEKIRSELGALEVPGKDAASSFLSLSTLYVKIQPMESGRLFQEAVKYINKTDGENPDFIAEKDYAPLRDYIPLPSELIELDESGTWNTIASVSSRRSRIRLKLGLLESALRKLGDVKRKFELEEKGKKEGRLL